MSIEQAFKKDVTYYLLGVIIPGLINFISIPYFKLLLGNSLFSSYSLLLTALLIINTVSIGWIGQSIIRLSPVYRGNHSFLLRSWKFSVLFQLLIILPVFVSLLFIGYSTLTASIFCVTLLLAGSHNTLIYISQSRFKALETVIAESIRIILFFLGAGLCIYFSDAGFRLEKIFFFQLLSYLVSCFFLLFRNKLNINFRLWKSKKIFFGTAKLLFRYGSLLMIWFLFSYLLAFTDRYFLTLYIDKNSLGIYIAQFDLIYKSITMVVFPVIVAFFPIISTEFEKGNQQKVSQFLRKVILIMVVGMISLCIGYFLIGYDILNWLLKFPKQNGDYRWSGIFIILGTVFWLI